MEWQFPAERTNFSSIKYSELDHTYHIEGKSLVSVTQLIDLLKPQFDSSSVAKRKASEQHITEEDILNQWAQKAEIAAATGTSVHNKIQHFLQYGDLYSIKNCRYFDSFLDFWGKYNDLYPVAKTYVEFKLGDKEYGLCGTLDCLICHVDGTVSLLDWKTNRKLESRSFGKSLNHPFGFVPASTINSYALQLTLYKMILERNTDFRVNRQHIIHITEHGWEDFDARLIITDSQDPCGRIHSVLKSGIPRSIYRDIRKEAELVKAMSSLQKFDIDCISKRLLENILDRLVVQAEKIRKYLEHLDV